MPELRRSLPIASLVVAAALALTGCGGSPSAAPSPSPTPTTSTVTDAEICGTPGGSAVDAVSVTGDLGSAPVVTFTAPLTVDTTERSVLIDGGTPVPIGTEVSVAYSFLNGTTGAAIETAGYAAGESPVSLRGSVDFLRVGFAKTIGCLGPGSRVVSVIPASEAFGDSGTDVGLAADDTLVFVADIIADVTPAAWATAWTTQLPTITEAGGIPTLTLPSVAPKTDVEVAVLTPGDGPVVGTASTVSVNYLGMKWEDGAVFDENYSKGAPSSFSVTNVVPGFSDALIGQRVGSRVLVTMPPAQGYGEAGTSTNALAGFTLVFLVDIVAITG